MVDSPEGMVDLLLGTTGPFLKHLVLALDLYGYGRGFLRLLSEVLGKS